MDMQTYKVRDPVGNIREIQGPAGASDDEIIRQAQALFSDKTHMIPQTYAKETPKGKGDYLPFEKTVGNVEALASAGTGMLGGMVGNVAGAAKTLFGGKYGTPEGIQQGQDTARKVSEAMTYQPRSVAGQTSLQSLSEMLDSSKLAGLGPTEGISLANVAPAALAQGGRAVGKAKNALVPAQQPEAIVGMGSAMTPVERIRAERAQSLPVPLDLTKGMLTRDFEQQRFERETAKAGKIGEPIRERHADLNQKILQNFDTWLDQTGAEAGGLRGAGQVVTDAIAEKANKAKAHINEAYKAAEKNGELQAPVDIAPLVAFLEKNKAESLNASVIGSTRRNLKSLAGPQSKDVFGQDVPQTIPLNDLEEIRKSVGVASLKDAPNGHWGKEIKGIIDKITEGAGGEAYQYARRMRSQYAKEFEDVGVIDKLMSTKPGTRDRSVAYEDVFKHSVLNGSLDDVRAVRKTLQTAGPQGEQAWKELQGQTVQHIKDEITKSVQTDTRGNRVVSPAKLDRIISELDKDGKLDFVFGKQGAQQMRDVNDVAKDVLTFPAGSVNTSNTTSVLLDALGSAAMGRLPTAGAKFVAFVKQLRDTQKVKKQVDEALFPGKSQPKQLSLKEFSQMTKKPDEATLQ